VTSGVSAGFGRRLAALLYDALLLLAILVLFTTALVLLSAATVVGARHGVELTPERIGAWAYVYRATLLLFIIGYYLLNWIRSGQTLGMRAWHLRVVTAQGKPLVLRSAARRLFWAALAWAPAGLGVLWIYWDADYLALQDRLSDTRVVHLSRS
jgi:uncharacterized RDD family membrane protein YckC